MTTYIVRPSNSEKDVFRIKLTAVSLLSLKLKPGDVVLLQLTNNVSTAPRPAIAWENSGSGMKDTIVQTSKALQELYGFKLGDRIEITRSSETLKDASHLVIRPLSATFSDEDQALWQCLLPAIIPPKYDVLTVGQKINLEVGNRKGEFEVADIGGLLGRITDDTQFTFTGLGPSLTNKTSVSLELSFDGVGGLRQQIQQIKEQIDHILSPELKNVLSWCQGRQGLLLYGPKGIGKSLLREELANNAWASVVRWTPGVKLPAATYPQLVIVDQWTIAGTEKTVPELLTVFQDIQGTQTLVIGEARHPNDISERLRTKHAFSVELELPIPDSAKRYDILRVLRSKCDQPSDEQLRDIAERTHGYVGLDLENLLYEIGISAYRRWKNQTRQPSEQAVTNGNHNEVKVTSHEQNPEINDTSMPQNSETQSFYSDLTITQTDIDTSLPLVRPSALQQIFLEKPSVKWADIGGQNALKHRLSTAVRRTLSPVLRQRMSNLGLEATKGVLLYGPPGCSKTLLAKALATEAELNFLAVKGAELISMYVGESERATREIFRKARSAAPSILFFDEIDAIASRSGESGASSTGNLNVLTTLLNEMDGFEELRNVLVVAATNKPQAIDPALLRPGRFDNVVYVGLPDMDTRREIFEKRFRHINVDEAVRARVAEFARLTEGYSGAEVVAICKGAGEYALDGDRDSIAVADVERAIEGAPHGITKDMLEEYERWNKARSAQG